MKGRKILVYVCVFGFLLFPVMQSLAAEPTIADYTSYPIFHLDAVAPLILIILDNSASMNEQAYYDGYDHNTRYYGYFEPFKKYSYASNIFVRDPSGSWDGNFLNWLTMRRIDVARKVLMGGLATSRQGTGNQVNIGEAPSLAAYDFAKTIVDSYGVTPFGGASAKTYLVDDGNFYVDGSTYVIRVDKNMNAYPDEAPSFVDGNIAGVLQKIGDRALWGNMFFNYGTGHNGSGGSVVSTLGTNIPSLVTDLQNTACDTFTPLAEAYYVAMQYFKQEDPQEGLDYPNGCAPNANIGDDPYWNGVEYVYCAKAFVILLTDGMSTMDMMIPSEIDGVSLKDCDGDSHDPGSFADSGSDYLDDVALFARTKDLRSDLDGEQNLILYTIYAFGDDPNAEQLLQDAAKNGGFIEKDGQIGPTITEEWSADGDAVPDTYYKASNGYQLEASLLRAVNDILRRAAAGSAVSVLATSGEGEANLVQAYYRPAVLEDLTDIQWVGYLQSLWVDSYGNLREDTDGNRALDVNLDNVITYFEDPDSGDTKIKRFNVTADPYPDVTSADYEILALDEITPLWEAGKKLAERVSERKIFTYLDKDSDGVVDEETTYDPLDGSGELVSFQSGVTAINPYLGVRDDAAWSYLGATHDERVTNLINYIRGEDVSDLRPRVIDGTVWKLGDIVNSTPVSISRPPDNYHILYSDESYQTYLNEYRDRETVVYVGANDGMLHAFTSWQYDTSSKQYVQPSGTSEGIGDELWAYIPQALLPHLKWLPLPDYTHVFYVDQKPKVFDAKIFDDDTHYTDTDTDPNWGTILLVGLNTGGKHIQVQDDFNYDNTVETTEIRHFYPSYICMDITNPREPKLLWERTYTDLEMSTSVPAIVRVGDNWFAVFGSGPSDYDGTSAKKGHVFVVDVLTGEPVYESGGSDWLFETGESYAFMNSPVTIDKDLNFNVDAIYFGETYLLGGTWKGKLYKVTIPWADSSGLYDGSDVANYSDVPDGTNPWLFSPLFNATRPITAPVTLSKDNFGNVWIYGGTGRYMNDDDKIDTDTQYLFGVKDPFFNKEHSSSGYYVDDYYHSYSNALELTMSDLLGADAYAVTTTGEVFDTGTGTSIGSYRDLVTLARITDGWYRTLTTPQERVLQKPSVLGGIVFIPSFVPSGDICSCGGESYLYGLYFETGTAWYEPVFRDGVTTMTLNGQTYNVATDSVYLGFGKASSLGIHSGLAEDATGFVQQSTGNVLDELLNPALNIKSSLKSWQEK
jgi:type IV pilus assembly protein PilY1